MSFRATILACAVMCTIGAGEAEAQLISPGRLTEAHAHLEGVTNCTSCHALGQRGVDPQRCLDCHTPLRDRIAAGTGFHSTVALECGTCHKDHFGRDFDPVRLDRAAFDHELTGYPLVGAHATLDCQSCHRPAYITAADVRRYHATTGRLNRTFLGVSTSCQTCHRRDNAHGPDFARSDCSTCHTPAVWAEVRPFDHATTGFPLAGAHATTSCASCHGETPDAAITFTGLSTTCASCHRDADPHGNQFRGRDCASCHAESGWRPATRFDHGRTPFPLTGAHRAVQCSSCHGAITSRTVFAGVDFAECSSCHADPHAGERGADCSTCHVSAGWRQFGAGFDEGRFDHSETGFALVGAHASLSCQSCHAKPARRDDRIRIQFAGDPRLSTFPPIVADDCQSCHVDAHRGVFEQRAGGATCVSCHGQQAWLPTTFGTARHEAETSFPLTGAHVATPCHACHGGGGRAMPHFEFVSTACQTCHADRNPHDDQFADAAGVTACGTCHSTERWDSARFDHAATGFPLTGAHLSLDCRSCHVPGADGRLRDFAGLEASCATCHAAADPHRDQFAGRSCDGCHDTRAFRIAAFDHDGASFPLTGAHQGVACAACHATERDAQGPFVRFKPVPMACAACHGGGNP